MRPISNPNKIQPMMFNQPCECWKEQTAKAEEKASEVSKPKTQKRTSKKQK
jgi:hypothetical protein